MCCAIYTLTCYETRANNHRFFFFCFETLQNSFSSFQRYNPTFRSISWEVSTNSHCIYLLSHIIFEYKIADQFSKRHWEFFHLLFFSFKNEALLRIKSRKHPWSILLCGTWILRECFKGNFIDKYRDCLLDHAALMLLLWKENQSVWTSFT